ncbi:MAG: rhodanese-like domain-containing protein [Microscillaceae bacterium]|nr:rhodanese-like domain-containing protein [Microscillaceae bacterium]
MQLLDVRSPEEFAQGYISGAKNINYSSLDFRTQVAKLDKKTPGLCLLPERHPKWAGG